MHDFIQKKKNNQKSATRLSVETPGVHSCGSRFEDICSGIYLAALNI